jgi:hypothetical protein
MSLKGVKRMIPRQPSFGMYRNLRSSHVVRANSSSANRRPHSLTQTE